MRGFCRRCGTLLPSAALCWSSTNAPPVFEKRSAAFTRCTASNRMLRSSVRQLEMDMRSLAVIGRREVMENAQSTFMSSTFWTERIGPTAALKTLEVMERVKSWELITQTGKDVTARWLGLGRRYGLPISTAGIPAIASFGFKGPNALAYKTLITQEMLAKGYLASTLLYVCTEHSQDVVDGYFDALEPVFALIRECEDGRDVSSLLKGPVCRQRVQATELTALVIRNKSTNYAPCSRRVKPCDR